MEITEIEQNLENLPKGLEDMQMELAKAELEYEQAKWERDVEHAKQTLVISMYQLTESAKRAKVTERMAEIESKLLGLKNDIRIKKIAVRRKEVELDIYRDLLRSEVAKMKLL